MKVEYTRLLIVLICLIIRLTNADGSSKSKLEFFNLIKYIFMYQSKDKNVVIFLAIFQIVNDLFVVFII
jgi:hypothetical protein